MVSLASGHMVAPFSIQPLVCLGWAPMSPVPLELELQTKVCEDFTITRSPLITIRAFLWLKSSNGIAFT